MSDAFLAADVGNSRVKIGRFGPQDPGSGDTSAALNIASVGLPQPSATLNLPLLAEADRAQAGARLKEWLTEARRESAASPTNWIIASVSRPNAAWLEEQIGPERADVRHLTHRDFPLAIDVEAPERVGVDRLAGAVAANCLRSPRRPAIVIDLGTAITIDLVRADGAFAGGAILPGIAMAARALTEQTDALPRSPLAEFVAPPSPVGKSTIAAIEAGLLWGTVGALGELIERFSAGCDTLPQVFVTGGTSPAVVPLLESSHVPVIHVPELVLAGIAIAAEFLNVPADRAD